MYLNAIIKEKLMPFKKRISIPQGLTIIILSTTAILIDQISKFYAQVHAPEIVELNTGIAFSIELPAVVQIILTIALISVGLYLALVHLNMSKISAIIAVSLVVGGAFGNLGDRIFKGHVVDFIDISAYISYPVFNIADIFIVVGIFYILLFYGKINKDIHNKTK